MTFAISLEHFSSDTSYQFPHSVQYGIDRLSTPNRIFSSTQSSQNSTKLLSSPVGVALYGARQLVKP
jgi:hypothetical protein